MEAFYFILFLLCFENTLQGIDKWRKRQKKLEYNPQPPCVAVASLNKHNHFGTHFDIFQASSEEQE